MHRDRALSAALCWHASSPRVPVTPLAPVVLVAPAALVALALAAPAAQVARVALVPPVVPVAPVALVAPAVLVIPVPRCPCLSSGTAALLSADWATSSSRQARTPLPTWS